MVEDISTIEHILVVKTIGGGIIAGIFLILGIMSVAMGINRKDDR